MPDRELLLLSDAVAGSGVLSMLVAARFLAGFIFRNRTLLGQGNFKWGDERGGGRRARAHHHSICICCHCTSHALVLLDCITLLQATFLPCFLILGQISSFQSILVSHPVFAKVNSLLGFA